MTGYNTMVYDYTWLLNFIYTVGYPKGGIKTGGKNFGGAQNVAFMTGLKKESLSKKALSGKGAIHRPLPNSQRKWSWMHDKQDIYV